MPLAAGSNESIVFTDKTTDLRPSNATANALMYNISPEYFQAAGTADTPARYRLEMNGSVRPDAPHAMRVAVTPAVVDVRTGLAAGPVVRMQL